MRCPQILPCLLPLLTLLTLAAPSAAQTASTHGLIRPGATLSNGEIVDRTEEAHVTNDGTWTALVRTETPGYVVVQNGTVILQAGDAISTGETVFTIGDIDVGPSGAVAYALTVFDGSGYRDVVMANGQILLEEFFAFVDPAVSPNSYTIRDFTEIAIAYPHLIVETRANGGGSAAFRDIVLQFDLSTPGAPVVTRLAEEGAISAGVTWGPRPLISDEMDILADGRGLFSFTAMSGLSAEDCIVFDGAIVARATELAPDATYRWTGVGPTHAGVNTAGQLMIGGDVDLASNGSFAGRRIFVDGVMRVDSGQPFGSGTTGAYFYEGRLDELGRLHFTHDAGVVEGYALDGEMMVEAGLALLDGVPIAGMSGGFAIEAISPDGRYVLLDVNESGAAFLDQTLCILETDLGIPVMACPAVPNSTGVIARLEASGSSYLGAGTFPLTAVDVPPGRPGLMICSKTPFFLPNPGGSAGNLCLGGSIGRFVGQIGVAGLDGTLGITVDPLGLPQGGGFLPAVAGEIWGFQLWYRDSSGTGPTSNFSQTRAIRFQ